MWHFVLVQPDELNVLEDGLQLWLIALRNAIVPDPQIVGLFPNLSLVLDHSTGAHLFPFLHASSLSLHCSTVDGAVQRLIEYWVTGDVW